MLGLNVDVSSFWIGAGFGAIAAVVILSLVLPDEWATWLVTRHNLPIILFPLGLFALVLGGGNLDVVIGWAVYQPLGMAKVAPWVWWMTLIGLGIVVLFYLTRRWHNFTIRRTP